MRIRTLLIFATLAIAAGAPLFFSGTDNKPGSSGGGLSSLFGLASSSSSMTTEELLAAPIPSAPSNAGNLPTFFVADFREVFRFDLTPEWIRLRWSQVSIWPGDDGLSGMRVPLVTGPTPTDLHGAATFYFDKQERLHRIVFKGWAGDPSRVVNLATNHFRFAASGAPTGLYVGRRWGQPAGVLQVDRAPGAPSMANHEFRILLEINDAAGGYALSRSTAALLPPMQ